MHTFNTVHTLRLVCRGFKEFKVVQVYFAGAEMQWKIYNLKYERFDSYPEGEGPELDEEREVYWIMTDEAEMKIKNWREAKMTLYYGSSVTYLGYTACYTCVPHLSALAPGYIYLAAQRQPLIATQNLPSHALLPHKKISSRHQALQHFSLKQRHQPYHLNAPLPQWTPSPPEILDHILSYATSPPPGKKWGSTATRRIVSAIRLVCRAFKVSRVVQVSYGKVKYAMGVKRNLFYLRYVVLLESELGMEDDIYDYPETYRSEESESESEGDDYGEENGEDFGEDNDEDDGDDDAN
ncbi:hypothetical protein BCR34DRAFT_596107 [Clohesyomyces aquaticus]|uniref:Uncharacterized protein n=1 Tax=Clohesyomyces aquaticus TaxID=1231657 RepID=A0A1Y2A8Z9_9PLEO|nr:hypothetical protein BCR34DRAFT_596107 [Clohesyomyces aquaticus]